MRGKLIAALLLTLCATQPAFAQKELEWVLGRTSGGTEKAEITVNSLKIDLNAPTAAAGAIIGADDIALTSVRSTSDLQTQLLSGFDENGVLQAGVALTGTPYLWFNPKMTVDEYAKQTATPMGYLRRLQFSLATKQLPEDGTNGIGVGAALSLQLNPKNEMARAATAMTCLQDALEKTIGPLSDQAARGDVAALRALKEDDADRFRSIVSENGVDNVEITRDAARELGVPADRLPAAGETMQLDMALELAGLKGKFDKLKDDAIRNEQTKVNSVAVDRETCDKDFESYLTSQDSWVLTVAQGFRSDTGKYDDLDTDRSAVYLQYRSGSENPISKTLGVPLIGLISYVGDETVKISDTEEEKADRFVVGLGSAAEGDGYALDFQVSFAKSDFQTARPDAEEFRATVAYSKQVATGVWLEFKAGTKSSDDVNDDTFVGVSFKLSPSVLGH